MGGGAAARAVGTMKRAGALVAVLAGGILAPNAASAPLVVRAAFDTPVVQFGDAIRTHVVVEIDRRHVRTDSLRIVDDIAPRAASARRAWRQAARRRRRCRASRSLRRRATAVP